MTDPISAPDRPPALEPCPTPLAWQQVVQGVLEASRPLEFAAEGVRVEGLEFGSGLPLVFLPPAAGTHRLFALTAWLLKDEFRCLMLGNIEWRKPPRCSELTARSAAVLEQVITTFSSEPVDLFASGTSMDAALELMRLRPERVRRAILQGGSGQRLTLRERLLLKAGLWFPGRLKNVPGWLPVQIQNHRVWFPPFDESRFGFLLGELRKQKTAEVARRLLSARTNWEGVDLSTVRQPVMLLHGEGEGPHAQAQLEQLEHNLPQAESTAMHTTGIYPYVTHPHRLVKVLRSHLQPTST
ncbi:MAG: alpha/beta hydrolase [Planctomycetaceae bacterium]|nr:alpha/beta hydrolase [Planctomycetaceae bacterium]